QRGWDTVAGYVGDEQACLGLVCDEEVVEVSGYGCHGNVAGGDVEVGRFRIGSRQNRCLNAACDFEFLLNFAELMVAMQTALCGYVAKGSEEEGEAEGLLIG